MGKIKIGILGLGVVGSAVARNVKYVPEIEIVRGCDIRRVRVPCKLTRDPYKIINDPEIAIVVEAIGGINPAKKYVLAAIRSGKHVVTSNKELVALHLDELMTMAKKKGVSLLFEGSVGGGIPILSTLRDSLSANKIAEIYGIVNGTTNYILSKMSEEGMAFSEALKKAREKGFAEADPRSDVEGYDAFYKAAILASVAFRAKVRAADVYREGIEKITAEDILYAGEIGYVIKLLAIAKMIEGKLDVRVHPALVSKQHPLAAVSENYNAIYVKGDPVGELMFYGQGAGGGPTASAIVSDIVQVSKGGGGKPARLRRIKTRKIEDIESRYYIRLQAPDRFGVLAGISKAFARKKVSIAAVVQKETVGNVATIVILLHSVAEKNLKAALKIIEKLPVVRKVSNVIRIV
ncbi:hypothetical protein AMJ44_10540 [candidate division WOR-1 bacterium DG_54_3]|uniref:Homoserine dehydrogenase n=1 Tax=candidate division WOR-1 bacterium DG_54_3 TaxID=1703775 RepID=A0A0S7XSX7_UNCSA|nr:MAG: hypothetical protein AMJ44_10540 [candidate division WOR-1 bacterium DG_54_3]